MPYDKSSLYKDAYVRNKRTLEKSGMTVNDPMQPNTIRMARSYLRSEIFLNLGSTEFTFPILTNDPSPGSPIPTPTPTEVRLKQQDVFFTCELGFFIYCYQTAGGNQLFKYQDMTFPDPNMNGGAWVGGLGMVQAIALWLTAQLNVQVNNVAVTPIYPLRRHCMVPVGQIIANGVFLPAQPPSTGLTETFNQINYDCDGYQEIWPNWILNGGNNNQYTLRYPQPVGNLGVVAGAQLWLALEWHGFLAQNASSIMSMKK